MRKYQQLVLILISFLSILVLIINRSENKRLKFVINVFGQQQQQKDFLSIENYSNFTYKFDFPRPTWTNLGNSFNGYSAFFKKTNELKAGGMVIAIVVASEALVHSPVSFQCKIHFTDNTIKNGKFGFMRVENEISRAAEEEEEKFIIYKFICKTQVDYNSDPKNLILINSHQTKKTEHYLPIRHLNANNRADMGRQAPLTVCLDLNSYNKSQPDQFVSDINLIQYFLFHELIGISNFIVYSSNIDQIHHHIEEILLNKYGVKINILPYNFPYALQNKEKNRKIIEADCFLRTTGLTKYLMVTSINEYLYPASRISSLSPLIELFNRYSDNGVVRFEVSVKTVCVDPRAKILSDNEKYSPDIKNPSFFIEKNELTRNEIDIIGKKSMKVESDLVVMHKYIKCNSDQDVFQWRTTMKEKHLEYLNFISRELNKLLFFKQK